MRRWLWRALIAGAVLAVGGFIVSASGVIPIKASSGHWKVTEWFLRFSMKRSIATHSFTIDVPDNLTDPSLILKGATHYEIGCRSCHGEPGMPRPRIAARMLPVPPDLAPRIRESNPKKLFYVVKHGMKFTGMPAWPSQHRDDEVWAMVAFLLKYPELDATEYRRLVQPQATTAAPIEELSTSVAAPSAVMQSCARCHGNDGLGRGEGAFPKLAGQRAEYLENALEAFARGRRHSGIMEPVAAGLAAESLEQIVRHYAGMSGESSASGPNPAAAAIERGRAIAMEGIRSQRVPSCIECHGPGARRGKPAYPSLAGQSANYLQLQLQLFKREQRGGSAYAHLMRPVAAKLTDEQMRDVALYFESLSSQPGEIPPAGR